jgi:hypothetical protein
MDRNTYKKLWMRKWRSENREKAREKYQKDVENRKKKLGSLFFLKSREYIYEWRRRNPEKSSAHKKVYVEVRAGRLKKEPCEVCGEVKVHAHHDDYSKPLKVRWLCPIHHGETYRLSTGK